MVMFHSYVSLPESNWNQKFIPYSWALDYCSMEDTEKKGTKIIFPDASDADLPGVFESPMASWAQKGY